MAKLLIKIFVKDYKNIENKNVRKKYGELASFVGILSNIFLFFIKMTMGIMINSVAVMVDSFNNLSDSLSSIITLLGFNIGAKPADKEHPFGHGRMEYIAGFVISFIMMLIGFEFLKASFFKIMTPSTIEFSYVAIIILIITIIVKIWQAMVNKKIGNLINSHSLLATAVDSRNDVIITIATVVSLVVFKMTGINIDGYFGFLISIFLIYSGFKLAKETISPLLGEPVDKKLEEKIKKISLRHDEIIGVHDILVHNYGPNKNIASLHVEIANTMDINDCHEIVDSIEREVFREYAILLTIHTDPVDMKDRRIPFIVEKIQNVLNIYGKELSTHDHRIIDTKNNINFIFDLVIPYGFAKKEQIELIAHIKKTIRDIDEKYKCIINIENSFTN